MTDSFSEISKRISADRWLAAIDVEYLSDFVPSGGSVVRFLSGEDDVLARVTGRLESIADRQRLWFQRLDPGQKDERERPATFHRMESFYKAVTDEFEWKTATERLLGCQLRTRGIFLPEGCDLSQIEAIAAANDRDPADLTREIKRIGTEMLRDQGLASDFRLAIAALAKERMLSESGSPSLESVLLEWLGGRSVPGGTKLLKTAGIYDRLRATTARATMTSFAKWIRKTDWNGAVVVLDFRPYEVKKLTARQRADLRESRLREAIRDGKTGDELELILDQPTEEPEVMFGDKAFLQMLDLLRHFIDDVEAFPGMGLFVLTTESFYDERSPRNFFMYNALQTRIAQEVRDSAHPNPVAILSHLGTTE